MVKRFTEVTSRQMKDSLTRRFIPLADSLRDLLTKFGLRHYHVQTVRVQWSGGKRGVGMPVVTETIPILPTPKIGSFDSISELASPIGLNEQGSIELSQISGRFTEEQLRGFPQDGDIPSDEEFFYEIEFFPNNGDSFKRRFYPRSAPAYSPGKLQWTVRLEKADEDRDRMNGDPG